ncbi:MAG: hypothetical protein ABIO70_27490 [Pseudomonadota bacterium]
MINPLSLLVLALPVALAAKPEDSLTLRSGGGLTTFDLQPWGGGFVVALEPHEDKMVLVRMAPDGTLTGVVKPKQPHFYDLTCHGGHCLASAGYAGSGQTRDLALVDPDRGTFTVLAPGKSMPRNVLWTGRYLEYTKPRSPTQVALGPVRGAPPDWYAFTASPDWVVVEPSPKLATVPEEGWPSMGACTQARYDGPGESCATAGAHGIVVAWTRGGSLAPAAGKPGTYDVGEDGSALFFVETRDRDGGQKQAWLFAPSPSRGSGSQGGNQYSLDWGVRGAVATEEGFAVLASGPPGSQSGRAAFISPGRAPTVVQLDGSPIGACPLPGGRTAVYVVNHGGNPPRYAVFGPDGQPVTPFAEATSLGPPVGGETRFSCSDGTAAWLQIQSIPGPDPWHWEKAVLTTHHP